MLTIIGLTGGIASGKSTVAGFIREMGIPVIDADQIAREVVQPGEPAWQDIIARFGEGILAKDQHIDRKLLGGIVFSVSQRAAGIESNYPSTDHSID